jgi:hypothetical protein
MSQFGQRQSGFGLMTVVLAPPLTGTDHIVRTNDVISRLALRALFGLEDDEDDPEPVAKVCAGQWRRESADTWRFWKHAPWSPDKPWGY